MLHGSTWRSLTDWIRKTEMVYCRVLVCNMAVPVTDWMNQEDRNGLPVEFDCVTWQYLSITDWLNQEDRNGLPAEFECVAWIHGAVIGGTCHWQLNEPGGQKWSTGRFWVCYMDPALLLAVTDIECDWRYLSLTTEWSRTTEMIYCRVWLCYMAVPVTDWMNQEDRNGLL